MKNSKTKKILSILLALVMLVGMIPMNSLTAYATELTEAEQTAETLPVLLGVNVTLADILDTSDGWLPYLVAKSAVFEPGTGTASVNFSNSVLYTNGSFSKPVETVSAGGRYYFYITVTSLPEYYPVDYSKISVEHINVTMYDYKVDFLYASEYSSGAYTGMKFCFMATHNPAPQLKFDEIVLNDGEYLKSGTPITSTTKPSGGYAYYYDGVLELNNYNSSFGSLYLKDMDSVEIKVVGSNVLSKIEETYTSTNTKKYTDITFTGDGSLNVSSNVPACVTTSGNVTVNSGTLTFGGGNALSGLSAASLTVKGGELVFKGTTSAINSGCRVDAPTIYVDESGATWDGTTDLSTYKYLRFVVPYICVGGVKLYDGSYLAVGATEITTTKPSGGYAYYKDGELTLNNYSYEGEGYLYDVDAENYSVIYAEEDLLITLTGNNTLVQTADISDSIFVNNGSLTIGGTGSLTNTDNGYGILASQNVTINGGTIVTTGQNFGIYSPFGDITINGGDITAVGKRGMRARDGSVVINGGEVTAVGSNCAIAYSTSFTGTSFTGNGVMEILASTTEDGALGEYVTANHDSYKKIFIKISDISVGGIGMSDGDYLAVGATDPQSTEPSGGYAYYKDGELTLNNYSYEGIGYEYNIDADNYSVIYTEEDLLITLTGNNTLVQTADASDSIFVKDGSLTIGGTGSLTNTDNGYGIYADKDIVINSGTILSTGKYTGICSEAGDITINGGTILSTGKNTGIRSEAGDITINGGGVTATSSSLAISAPGGFTIPEGMKIEGSYTVDGVLSKYVAANHDRYKKIVVGDSVIKVVEIYVGGVRMYDGDYLAVGATTTTTTQPSGGYAYYSNDTLVLNNYSYEGEGYYYDSLSSVSIYSVSDLTVNLIGTNILNNPTSYGDNIRIFNGSLTIGGTGSLTCNTSGNSVNLYANYDIVINGGTINCNGHVGIKSSESIIINDGSIIVDVAVFGLYASKDVVINGGTVTVKGNSCAIKYDDSFTVADGLTIQASTTQNGTLGKYVAAYHDSYQKIVIEPCAFTVQPFVGALETGKNQTVYWALNFTPVKTEILQYSGENSSSVVRTMIGSHTKASLAISDNEYCVRVYYSDTGYVTSDRFYVTEKVECIWVGGVVMFSGDYLAVGATETQSTEPSGGYAYYKDGILTLNNYNYEGAGYCYHESFDAVIGEIKEYAIIYATTGSNTASGDLTIRLVGTNNLVQNQIDSSTILVRNGYITIEGSGSLSCSGAKFGIRADFAVYINEGTVNVTAESHAIYCNLGDVEISGGNVTASGKYGIAASENDGSVYVFGGTLKATGTTLAIAVAETFETDESLKVWACVYNNGMMSEYVAEDLNRYEQILVSDKVAEVSVGGVDMYDGDYLAVGATETTTSKPSGGYAYYKDGVLTLNNYSYEGQGRKHGSYYMNIVAAGRNLTIELVGNNTLVQTNVTGDNIFVERGSLTIGGTGSLTASAGGYNILANKDITINGGTIICNNNRSYGIACSEDIIVNGGDITVTANKESISASDLKVNGGNITAICTSSSDYYSAIYATNFVIGDHVTVKASTTADGEPDEYIAANHDSYKKIVVYAGAIVSGTVTSFNSDTDDITIELWNADNTQLMYSTTETGKNPTYSISVTEYGTYNMVITTAGHVPYYKTIDLNADSTVQDVELQLYADTNLDGVIDVEDYQALINTVLSDDHEQIETEEYDDLIHYDIDGDGYLDVIDAAFMVLIVNGHITIDEVYDLKKGDYDYDGEAYTESDLIAMYHVLSDIDSSAPTLSTSQKFASDLNYNGRVDSEDLAILTGRYGTIEATTCEENIKVYYRWGNSYTTCTATAICTICDKHVAKETVNSVKNADGSYTATFKNSLLGTKTFKKQ